MSRLFLGIGRGLALIGVDLSCRRKAREKISTQTAGIVSIAVEKRQSIFGLPGLFFSS